MRQVSTSWGGTWVGVRSRVKGEVRMRVKGEDESVDQLGRHLG